MSSDARRLCCPTCRAVFRRELRRCPADGSPLAELAEDPLLGEVLGARYLVQALLAEGGMGRVYFATDAESGRGRYAIKVLFGELAADPRHYERFVREAVRASGFDHPNLVRVLDFGSTAGKQPYVVMEHLAGRSLTTLVKQEAPFESRRAARLLGDVCRALDEIHRHKIIHRDVKTGNVMVVEGGDREVAKLFDFGVSLETESREERLTTRQTAIGTLTYMSPERTLCQAFDHRSDLFSLGVVLYQMLAGERPFSGTPMMVAIQNLTLTPPRIAERVPGLAVDERLEAIALKLMQRDPARRYQSAAEVLSALEGGSL
ncbi:MAG TPA: serine/threonine-protein kinase [Kofleriaceae bacterium]|nr:serine/threonine-protein kinase [Kofleriaceae bacterium]